MTKKTIEMPVNTIEVFIAALEANSGAVKRALGKDDDDDANAAMAILLITNEMMIKSLQKKLKENGIEEKEEAE